MSINNEKDLEKQESNKDEQEINNDVKVEDVVDGDENKKEGADDENDFEKKEGEEEGAEG